MIKTFYAPIALVMLLVSALFAQTAVPPKPATAPSMQTQIDTLLKSGNPENINQAFTLFKQQFAADPKQAEIMFKNIPSLPILARQTGHTDDILGLIKSAKSVKKVKNLTGALNNVEYLWALQIIVLYRADRHAEAMAEFDDGFAQDLGRPMSNAILKFWPLVSRNNEKQDEFLNILQLITMRCWDADIVENALKKRIELLNATNKRADALIDAKRLFIITSIPHTAAALTAFERQLSLADPSKVADFRTQQADAKTAPVNFESTADAHKSSILLGIKLEGTPDKSSLESHGDGTSVERLLHTALVHLLYDQTDEALDIITKTAPLATDPFDAAALYAMTAKLMKSQDGTPARATAYYASKPPPPKPASKPATPKTNDIP